MLNENFSVAFSDRGNGAWTLELTPKAAPLNKIFNRISLAGSAYLDSINLDDKPRSLKATLKFSFSTFWSAWNSARKRWLNWNICGLLSAVIT